MSAIVAKALNSTIGTGNFKGFDQVIKEVLEENNTNIERILTDFTTKMNAKGLVASDNLYYYLWKGNFGHSEGYDNGGTVPVGDSITFNCNGSVNIGYSATSSKGNFRVYLNDVFAFGISPTNEEKVNYLKINAGDVLRCEVERTYDTGTSKYYGHATNLSLSIIANDVNLSAFGL